MKIFLGYPSEYESAAWQVYNALMSAGDDVWFDKVSLVAGVDWDKEREKGQLEAELVVHLCSEAILKRAGVVNREIRHTLRLTEDQPLGSLYVIPIRLEPIKMPLELTRFQYFDFEEGWEKRLLEGVTKRRAQLSGLIPETPIASNKSPDFTHSKPQKIEFEEITETHECRGEYLCYQGRELYWTLVNSALASQTLKSFFEARSDFTTLIDDLDNADGDERKHEWSVSTEEVFRSGDLVSVRNYTYLGFARAAHPNHYITTLNFFGMNCGQITIEQLLEYSPEAARKILIYCEKVIIAEFEDEIDGGSFFEGYKDTDENVWKLLAQFNFDGQGMTFNFSPYDVLPFVFGSHEIHVPWRFIESMISETYRDVIENLMSRD